MCMLLINDTVRKKQFHKKQAFFYFIKNKKKGNKLCGQIVDSSPTY